MQLSKNFKITKLACYSAYFTMSSIFCLPPLLFMPFRDIFGISYTLLGTLVLINFVTQMTIDLILSFLSKRLDMSKIVRWIPLITTLGMALYALLPLAFPSAAYLGLVVGTVVFSLAAGLSEVILSPTIAAIPSDNPQRDMSILHSLYAFGVFFTVVTATLLLKLFTAKYWFVVVLIFAALPVIAALLFMLSPMPDMSPSSAAYTVEKSKSRTASIALCAACIFFGSCAENVMSNWVSSFVENALGIDKALGDVLGVAGFAILLGIVRITYARFGKKIMPVLLVGSIGAVACYLVAGLSSSVVLALIACVLVGAFTAMLWPGTLIMMEDNIPSPGVAAYALMAASGDLGASLAPQLMGVVIDKVTASGLAVDLSVRLALSPEQIGLKAGMLVTSLFPLIGIVIVLVAMRRFKSKKEQENKLF